MVVFISWITYAAWSSISIVDDWDNLTSEIFNNVIGNLEDLNTRIDNLPTPDTWVPIWTIQAWHKDMTWVPILSDGWVECDWSSINDVDSPMNWQVIPNLNWDLRFLRWGSISWLMQDATGIGGKIRAVSPSEYNTFQNHDGAYDSSTVAHVTYSGRASTAQTYYKVRPINMTVVYIMKIK